MPAKTIFDAARVPMGPGIRPAARHQGPLVHLVEQDEPALPRRDVVVDPDLAGRNERIDLVVPALGEIDEEDVPDDLAVDDPGPDLPAVFRDDASRPNPLARRSDLSTSSALVRASS
jgi:hypothetical protein